MQHTANGRAAGNAARVALISGAASGIGLATAARLVDSGWTVYAGFRPEGRSGPPRQAEPPAHLHWLPLEVTDAAARRAALRQIESAHGRLDALINNAGIHTGGPLEEVPEGTLRQVMEVNFFGAIALTRTFLPLMRRAGRGVILMVSSLSGLIGLPFDGAYAASKFALEGASESLRYELEPFGVKVALLEPGAYATALVATPPGTGATPSAYGQYEQLRRARAGQGAHGATPTEAARIIEETLLQHAPHLRVPCGAQALAVTERLRTLAGDARRDFALAAAGVGARG